MPGRTDNFSNEQRNKEATESNAQNIWTLHI